MNTLHVDEREDRVVVTLDRPAQRNAINAEMIDELHQVCGRLERDPKLLLLAGRGDHFAGGADIAELRERGREEAFAGINRTLFDRIGKLPLPTVAAVSGYALGGGAELTYACDIRIATTTAVFGNPEPNLGIMAAAGAAIDCRSSSASRSRSRCSSVPGTSTPSRRYERAWLSR